MKGKRDYFSHFTEAKPSEVGYYNYPHITNEETEAQRDKDIYQDHSNPKRES